MDGRSPFFQSDLAEIVSSLKGSATAMLDIGHMFHSPNSVAHEAATIGARCNDLVDLAARDII